MYDRYNVTIYFIQFQTQTRAGSIYLWLTLLGGMFAQYIYYLKKIKLVKALLLLSKTETIKDLF